MTNANKNKKIFYILSFTLPILIMLFAYLNIGVFRDKSILINDLSTQYINFLSYFRNSIFENGIFYSFAKDMGGNFFGVFSYYLASPLNFITFLFSPENIEYAASVIILLRFGLYGVSFLWFLSKQEAKIGFFAVAFSVLYALSSFMAILSYHILWADAFILLPVMIAGQQDLLKGKKATLFMLSFTLLLFINYYMGYMVGIFCIFYFIFHCIAYEKKQTIMQSFLKLARASLVSIGIAACTLIPSFFSLLQGKFVMNGEFVKEAGYTTFNIFSIIPKLFCGGYDSVGNVSAPFLYCGGAIGLLVLGYFFLQNKTRREKLAAAFILCVFGASLYFVPLYKVWHMFSLTNAFPYRFSFIVCFFMIFLGYEAFIFYKNIDYKKYLPLCILLLFLTTALGVWYPVHIRNIRIAFTALVGLFAVGSMAFASKKSGTLVIYLAAIVFMADISLNAVILTKENYTALGTLPKDSFKSDYIAAKAALPKISEDEFYRVMFMEDADAPNTSLKMGYNNYYYSFTSLPSTESEAARQNIIHTAKFAELARAVFGVKLSLFENVITEYPYEYFPLIYTKKSDTANVTREKDSGLFLNDYILSVTGISPVVNGKLDTEMLKKACSVATENGIKDLYQKANRIKGTLAAKEATTAYTSISYDESWQIRVNGQKVKAQRALENFICFSVPKGENVIAMTYYPKGIFLGLAITAMTLLAVIVKAIDKKIKG